MDSDQESLIMLSPPSSMASDSPDDSSNSSQRSDDVLLAPTAMRMERKRGWSMFDTSDEEDEVAARLEMHAGPNAPRRSIKVHKLEDGVIDATSLLCRSAPSDGLSGGRCKKGSCQIQNTPDNFLRHLKSHGGGEELDSGDDLDGTIPENLA